MLKRFSQLFVQNMKLGAIGSIALVLTLLLTPLAVQAQGPSPLAPLVIPENVQVIPNQYIVVYKANANSVSIQGAVDADVVANGGEVKFMYGTALKGYGATLPAQALAAVRANPAVDYVIADAIVTLDPAEAGDVGVETTQPSATWGLDRIDQRDLPLSTTYTYANVGVGVHAYVIDTGIRSTHTQFGGRATKDYDAIGDGQNGNDCAGHGTHVAGTIGGSTYGVAKNVRLHAIRVLNCAGSGSYSQVIAGVNWVTAHHLSPAVANMSLGGSAYGPLDTALNQMMLSGVVLVVAAGNSNDNACNYSPARVPNAITVAATSSDDVRSDFSNWGSCVDIFAPGSDITSSWNTSNTAIATISGTSMASPHVAGVVVLYLHDHPGATYLQVRNALVANASLNKVIDPAGSANRMIYSRFPVPVIPDPIAPTGSTTDKTPTYKWSRIAGATQYRYQLMKGATLVYTKAVTSSACGVIVCTNTPTTVLGVSNLYKWRVQAFVGGVWQAYSAYKTFTIH